MQLEPDEHFREIVISAWQAFLRTEERLRLAVRREVKNDDEVRRACYDALREGGAAAFYLHHFADVVFHGHPTWLPRDLSSLDEVRAWVSGNCTASRTERPISDVPLLSDIANALKHSVLIHKPEKREVRSKESVLVLSGGFGQLAFGEGNFGGFEQVLVLTASGSTRALSAVLQNVTDAWRRAMGLDIPELGKP